MTGEDRAGGRRLGRGEFVALVALMMALTALSIDVILPAFDEIRNEFDLAADSTQTASIVTAFFFGLALPQLVYGPLADRFGRKRVLYAGFALFAAGAITSATATSFEMILVGRFIWGVGAAGPRVIALSIIRDRFEGEQMARVMSFIMAVFVLVPVVAPTIGAGIVAVAPWRGVFWFCVAYLGMIVLWSLRLPETLDPTHRIEVSPSGVKRALGKVIRSRQTMGYLVTMSVLNGVFLSYLASSELIWEDVYDRGSQFPFIFGGVAILIGGAMLTSGLIVDRVGISRLTHIVLAAYLSAAVLQLGVAVGYGGTPPFWVYLPVLALPLAMQGLMFPNFNTLAMIPVGEVAGTASAMIGAVSIGAGSLLGLVIDRSFNGTVTPLAMAFVAAGIAALLTVAVTERGQLQLRSRRIDPAAVVPPVVD